MNVLQVSSSLGWGGREMYPLVLAEGLSQRGHKIIVIANPKSRMAKRARKAKLPTITMGIKGYFNPKAIFLLKRVILKEKVDIIHVHFSKDLWWVVPSVWLSCRNLGLVLTKHLESGINKKGLLHRLLYARLDKVIAISGVVRRNLLKSTSLKDSQLVTLYYGLDLKRYDPERFTGKTVRAELGLGSETKIVGIVGRLSPRKGQEEFLKAAKIILESHPEVIFLIVGEDFGSSGYKEHLRRLAQGMGILGRVIFTGQRDDIPDVMASLDIFVFTSYAEAFGLVLIEAMAMKRPVVAFDAGAIREIVEEAKSGLLVPLQDVSSLARAIDSLLENSQRCRELGERGREIVDEKFDLSLAMAKTEKLYEEICL